tara:strand:- start:610 stop:834 length:225 start_codon:yes stop_codon:yes gene_type:complete
MDILARLDVKSKKFKTYVYRKIAKRGLIRELWRIYIDKSARGWYIYRKPPGGAIIHAYLVLCVPSKHLNVQLFL